MTGRTCTERIGGSPVIRREQRIAWSLIRALGRIEVHGLERVPATGPVVLAVNHRSFLDGPLLFGLLPRPLIWLAKREAFTPVLGPVLRSAGQVPVSRGIVDPVPVRECVRLLRAGGVLGLFPEGSRGPGLAAHAHAGVGYFPLRTGAVVVPVACSGTDAMTHRRTVGRPAVRIQFGAPIPVARAADDLPLSRRAVAATAEHVRVRLAALVAENDAARHGEATRSAAHMASVRPGRGAA